jgi:hypothetical protein
VKRYPALITVAILLTLTAACTAPGPIYVMREVTVVATLTASPDEPTVPPPTSPPVPPPTRTPEALPTPPPAAPTPEPNPYDLTLLGQWADEGYLVYFQINADNVPEAEAFRQRAFEYAASELAASYPDVGISAPEDLESINRQLMGCMGLDSSDLSLFFLPMPSESEAVRICNTVWRSASSDLAAAWVAEYRVADSDCIPQATSEFQWLVLTFKGDPGPNPDSFVADVVRIIVDRVPEFQTESYWPDLLQSVHDYGIANCFPPSPGEFNVAIRFNSEYRGVYSFGTPGNDGYIVLEVLGLSQGLALDRAEYFPGEQCVVRK